MKRDGYYFHFKGKNAETFVHELAQKSFLTDWCYLNPKLPDGKELCDLLVVYDNIAIIWQIKSLKLRVDGKYKKQDVGKNIRQILGANRSLFGIKIPVDLENPRRGKEKFNPSQITETYLISTLIGEDEDYSTFVEKADGHVIHVFTRDFVQIVLNELDTIKDFIGYLREKENLLFRDNKITLIGGEKELLAYYLLNERSFKELKKSDHLVIDEGSWVHLQRKTEYKAKKKADEISYGWDEIINRAHTGGDQYEKVARELARTSRFERRILSKTFYEAHVLAHNTVTVPIFRRMMPFIGVTYCFLFFDDPEPREIRKAMLGNMCFVARGLYRKNKLVVGIATEMRLAPSCSYDFLLLEIPKWTEELQKKMEEVQKEARIFLNPKEKKVHEDEYPKD